MTIDLRAHLRRIKPDKHIRQLVPRQPEDLVAAADFVGGGRAAIMVDTNVYIHAAAGTLPAAAKLLVVQGLLFHCSVCVGELSTGIANADPAHADWKALRDYYAGAIASIPATRLLTPDPDVWAEAGLIAGTLARAQNWQRHQRKEALNDALIFLTAAKAGLPVLTANRDEFDLIQQLAPHGRFIHF
ncbi:PIN domain-containing protein [Sphingobium sp. SJ10-10]|uniref:type II toxin-antitoxin system VapC family toxin n=1 Tax=Sphingobium sp. SJ10-10 TaxID=3114999 RepID=UPI002E1978D6|nr:PIN domain-containing protein [Sphingobium sp. SJ10-10]